MRLGLSILKADCCVSWIKSEPFFGKIPTLNFDNFRSGGQKGRGLESGRPPGIFARPRFLPRSERKAFYYWGSAAAEFRASEAGAPPLKN